MATLAAQTNTDLNALITPQTLQDLTRLRDATGSINTTLLQRAADFAAAKVESFLGDNLTDTDVIAVSISVRLALLDMSTIYSLRLTPEGTLFIGDVNQELKDLALRRARVEADPVLSTPDFVRIDLKYPAVLWKVD